MQSGLWLPTDRCLSRKDRSETRMPTGSLPIPTGHRLGVEDIQRRYGVQWTHWTQLDDLNCADDLALLRHNDRCKRRPERLRIIQPLLSEGPQGSKQASQEQHRSQYNHRSTRWSCMARRDKFHLQTKNG